MGALLFQFYQIFAVTSGWGSVVQTLASASVGVFYVLILLRSTRVAEPSRGFYFRL